MALQNIVGRLVDVIFGYDFFVSYTGGDGSKYAHSLYEKLKAQGFTVVFDEEEYARGDNWTLLGRRALKKTRQLVLVALSKLFSYSRELFQCSLLAILLALLSFGCDRWFVTLIGRFLLTLSCGL
jgi:hypothetical protein